MKSVMILLAALASPALAVDDAQSPASPAAPSQQAGRDAEAAFRAGYYKWQRQQPVEALADFDRALVLTPNSSIAHAARALALADMRRFDDADAGAATALRLRPSDAFAQGSSGYVHLLRGAFLDGAPGWRFHKAQADYVLEKYRRLRDLS
jgi:Flp pilus assembly protein TadD